MSVCDSFDAVYEFGQTKVDDKASLQFLESQIRETLCRIDGVVRSGLAFNDNEIVNKDVYAERMLRVAQVLPLVDNRTRRFKLCPVSMYLKFVRKRTLIDLFENARSSKCLVNLNGTGNNVFGDVGVFSVVVFMLKLYQNELTHEQPAIRQRRCPRHRHRVRARQTHFVDGGWVWWE